MPSRDKLIRQSSYIFLFLITMGGVLYILFSARIPSELPALTPFRGIALIMIGLLAGWIGAMIGVAGGIIILPLLHFWLGYPTPLAVGTSFIISMFTSASGAFAHMMRKNLSLEAVKWIASAGIAGVLLGSYLFTHLVDNTGLLGLMLGIVFIIPSIIMIWDSAKSTHSVYGATSQKRKINPPGMVLLGFITGTLAGLLGLGGGFLIVPTLIYIFNFPFYLATGTSLATIFPISVVGALIKLSGGYADLLAAILASLGTIAGAQIGSITIKYFKPSTLKLIFSLYFLYISARFIINYFY